MSKKKWTPPSALWETELMEPSIYPLVELPFAISIRFDAFTEVMEQFDAANKQSKATTGMTRTENAILKLLTTAVS